MIFAVNTWGNWSIGLVQRVRHRDLRGEQAQARLLRRRRRLRRDHERRDLRRPDGGLHLRRGRRSRRRSGSPTGRPTARPVLLPTLVSDIGQNVRTTPASATPASASRSRTRRSSIRSPGQGEVDPSIRPCRRVRLRASSTPAAAPHIPVWVDKGRLGTTRAKGWMIVTLDDAERRRPGRSRARRGAVGPELPSGQARRTPAPPGSFRFTERVDGAGAPSRTRTGPGTRAGAGSIRGRVLRRREPATGCSGWSSGARDEHGGEGTTVVARIVGIAGPLARPRGGVARAAR